MKAWKQAIINAGIMAGISAMSILIATQEITDGTIKAVVLTFGITFLSLCGRYFRPPKTDINDEKVEKPPEEKKSEPWIILGALWV